MANDRLKDKVAIVTGASRGIGRGISTGLGAAGAGVAVNYRDNQDEAEEVVENVTKFGGRAMAVRADVADVTHVIVTPFQPYALGNLLALPNAAYCLSRTGWIDFHAPRWRDHPHDYRPFVIPAPILTKLVTARWDQVRLLEDEEELLPGLSVFWTGAHHRSSMAVKAATDQGAVIASDCFMRAENVTENRPLGINESLAETLTAYERIRREADVLVPLYDPAVFRQHPNGIGPWPPGQQDDRMRSPAVV